ncbi:MAG: tRNA (adenosine(37)-N6)-threonylcarbamoyltransferase complex ATPase subunit type 1 TsaE [Parvibaculales bacterium]
MMMSANKHFAKTDIFCPDEAASLRFAAWLSGLLQAGDIVFLNGDLGAGKTSFARGIIRALIGNQISVPSPTFTLVQDYQGQDFPIYHADLYRLEDSHEAEELDLFAHPDRLVLLEWGSRLFDDESQTVLSAEALRHCIHIDFSHEKEGRCISLSGPDAFMQKLTAGNGFAQFKAREQAAQNFLQQTGYGDAAREAVAGDASGRRYERLQTPNNGSFIFMDWPQTVPQNTYAQQVHLGTNTESFITISAYLRALGLNAPRLYAADKAQGFLVLEDFGSQSMTALIDRNAPNLPIIYAEAIETLAQLHQTTPPKTLSYEGASHDLMTLDRDILKTELGVFLQWYAPHQNITLTEEALAEWDAIWGNIFDKLFASTDKQAEDLPQVLVLRDFHSPNIMWCDAAQSLNRIGLIDVQDALIGAPAYDVVSLLQDARRDVSEQQAAHYLAHYLARTGFDEARFMQTYFILGAQRNLRIAGVFARLAMRDARPEYLAHIPRVFGYLSQCLKHEDLQELKNWLQNHL